MNNDIDNFIERNKEKLSYIRIVCGNNTKADTIALLSIDMAYIPSGDHAVKQTTLKTIAEETHDILIENGYGTFSTYMRIYAYDENGKQYATLQRTCQIQNNQEQNAKETQQIAPIVAPLMNGIIKMVDQLMSSNEILSNSLAHSQDVQLRLMDSMIEAKEEGIDYQAIAVQTQMLLENMQPPQEDNSDIGEKLLNVLSMGMAGGMPVQQPTDHEQPDPASSPSKEDLKAWARADPGFIKKTVEAYQEFSQENNTTKNNQHGDNDNE